MSAQQDASSFWPSSPYKGLNYYGAKDAPLFCERDEEIETCAHLLGSPSTKLLLLHGRTGTGKSSFLRAGLFAKSLKANPMLFLMEENGEPCFIRSTADPIESVSEMLESRIGSPAHFGRVPEAARTQAAEILRQASRGTPAERTVALRRALEHLTAELSGTLVLVIDQAEEVFTLESRGGSPAEHRAYFEFLDELCFERFDIKVILALRTEYYGQFADSFRIPPNLKVSPVVSGLEQYMLQGVQKQERLQAAIDWPTLDTSINGHPSARSHYRFRYVEGLSAQIAADIVQHCGESSALPVLQIVCSDLYAALPPLTEEQQKAGVVREIKASAYRDGGGVPGAIDRYIERAIADAVCGSPSEKTLGKKDRETIDAWKYIVSSLVTRQEGGALTSLLLSQEALEEKAREAGMEDAIGERLKKLSRTETRLLRAVNLHDRTTGRPIPHFSLGHDALAPSLFGWQETRGKEIEESTRARRRAKWWIGVSAAAIVVALLIFGLASALWVAARSNSLMLRTSLQTISAEPVVSQRMLRLTALIANTPHYWRWFIPGVIHETEDALRDMLLRAPIVAEAGLTTAVAADGKRLVVVAHDGSVILRRLGPEVTRVLEYVVPVRIQDSYLLAGFVQGTDQPIVSANSQLYFGGGKSIRTQRLIPERMSSIAPFFRGDVLEISSYSATGKGSVTYDISYDSEAQTLRPGVPVEIKTSSLVNVVSSPYGPFDAYTVEGGEPEPSQEPPGISLFIKPHGESEEGTKILILPADAPGKAFSPGSIAFLPDNRHVAFRPALDSLFVVELTPRDNSWKSVKLSLPSPQFYGARLRPIALQQKIRPPLAAVGTTNGFRFAWLSEAGLIVADASPEGDLVNWGAGRATSSTLLTSIQQADMQRPFLELRFDASGDYLTLSTGSAVRTWDLSRTRAEKIRSLESTRELIDAACRAVEMSGELIDGNQLRDEDFETLPVSSRKQPCAHGA